MYKFCIDICHGILIVVISHVSQRVASVLRARMRPLSFVSAVSLSANSQIKKQEQAKQEEANFLQCFVTPDLS